MRARSTVAAVLVAGLAVAAATEASPVMHRKLSQGIDEGAITGGVISEVTSRILGELGTGGIDIDDLNDGLVSPLLAPFTDALGGGLQYVLQPVYQVFQQVPGLGVCN
mgnify:CR=1 FL=1